MILISSSRSGGANLATHLMRTDQNEHVDVHELRGFVADNLHDAFKEVEAISRATKCKKYLFSISLNPPEEAAVSVEEFIRTVDRIEEKLGLVGQPRALVFHEKENRRHLHAVFSRIDAETMTAREMDFHKLKLRDISRELYLENGWKIPRGLMNSAERDPTNFSRAEWEQAKRFGQDPRWIKQVARECWTSSDNAKAFQRSLEDRSMHLAIGDRRSFVIVDSLGGVYSLPKALDIKTKEVRARLGDGAELPNVQDAQRQIGERLTPAMRKHIEASRKAFADKFRPMAEQKAQTTQQHREARRALELKQANERDNQAREAQSRMPRGLRGLWNRITGRYQEMRRENEAAADAKRKQHDSERQALIESQREQRRALQSQIASLRKRQAEQLLELRRDLGRFLKLSRSVPQQQTERADRAPQRGRGPDHER